MVKSNLDKFLEIEKMMHEAENHMQLYEDTLKERYNYMNDLRREHSNLSHTLGKVHQKLAKKAKGLEEDKDIKAVVKDAVHKIDVQIEAIQEDYHEEVSRKVEKLTQSKEELQGKVQGENIREAWNKLNEIKVNIEEVTVLKELVDSMKNMEEDTKQSIMKKIDRVRSEYVSSFVNYRKSFENGENVPQLIIEIIKDLDNNGFSEEAELLADVKPNINESRGQRPETETLLSLLNPIKRAGLEYFQSNNKKSESYDLNVAFSKEVAYTRRALLEDREYIGTRNAFNRLKNSFEELSTYMYERYHQLGGTPNNYHGHEDRKRS